DPKSTALPLGHARMEVSKYWVLVATRRYNNFVKSLAQHPEVRCLTGPRLGRRPRLSIAYLGLSANKWTMRLVFTPCDIGGGTCLPEPHQSDEDAPALTFLRSGGPCLQAEGKRRSPCSW